MRLLVQGWAREDTVTATAEATRTRILMLRITIYVLRTKMLVMQMALLPTMVRTSTLRATATFAEPKGLNAARAPCPCVPYSEPRRASCTGHA